eukprot:COSAG01_NODE_32037_length_587_cov_1.165984_1_plen_25_part_10
MGMIIISSGTLSVSGVCITITFVTV